MYKWITANLGIKILSFFTAILLWFHVITERTYEKTVTIPISCINLKEGLLLTKPPPESVKIRIGGKGKELLRFGRGSKVVLDLGETELGWKRINLEKKDITLPSESKIRVVSEPTPMSFVVRIEKKVTKRVKIIPDLKAASQFEVIPEMIEISGGGGDVYPVSQITTEEIVGSYEPLETLRVKLKIPEGIKTSVDSVTVILKQP